MSENTNVDATPETDAATTQQENSTETKPRKRTFEQADGVKAFTQYPFLPEEVAGGEAEYDLKCTKLNRQKHFANDEVYIAWRKALCEMQKADAIEEYNAAVEKFDHQCEEDIEDLTRMAELGIEDEDGRKGKLTAQLLDKLSDEEKKAIAKLFWNGE